MNKKIDPLASFEISSKVIAQYGVDVESEIMAALTQQITDEIDRNILETLIYNDTSYTKIVLDRTITVSNEWLNENIKNRYRQFGVTWYFKERKDATLFVLRWGGSIE